MNDLFSLSGGLGGPWKSWKLGSLFGAVLKKSKKHQAILLLFQKLVYSTMVLLHFGFFTFFDFFVFFEGRSWTRGKTNGIWWVFLFNTFYFKVVPLKVLRRRSERWHAHLLDLSIWSHLEPSGVIWSLLEPSVSPWAPPGPDFPILGHPLKPIIFLRESRPVINIQALGASRATFPYSGPPSKTYQFLKRKSASSQHSAPGRLQGQISLFWATL